MQEKNPQQQSYSQILDRINKRENLKLLYTLVFSAIALAAVVIIPSYLLNSRLDLRQQASTGATTVTITQGKLNINGTPFTIRGINYNPTSIGDSILDSTAPVYDVPKIAALGANTIATYFIGRADYDQWLDLDTGVKFYNNLYPAAENNNLMLILGYYSNDHVNWNDTTQVARLTSQYQDMVMAAKDRPSTLIYMIGNEVFEKISDESQRVSYAKWIGNMVNWTHQADPNHPVMYTDLASYIALPYLKQYASNLDIYGINHYDFNTNQALTNLFAKDESLWPQKPLMLHEWGTDAYNVNTRTVDNSLQASQMVKLAQIIDAVVPNHPVIGAAQFEFSDEYRIVGSASTQDPDSGWGCSSCFDGKANEDYWGLATATAPGKAESRSLKPSYYSLQQYWLNTNNIPTGTITVSPTTSIPTPTSIPTVFVSPTTTAASFSISGLKTTNKTRNSITILWTTSIPTKTLLIYGTSSTNLSSNFVDNNISTSHSYTLNNLLPNTKYFYRVFSSSAENVQKSSSVKSFSTAK